MLPFRTVFFDCDSTLSSIEGIDELGREFREQVVPLTDAAMRGEVSLESVYARRLAIIRPSHSDVERVGRLYVRTLVPGAADTVVALQAVGVAVYIISGGLRPAVLHVARALGVPAARVFAVDVSFHPDGSFAGFEEDSALARRGGKPALIASLGPFARPSMMVGDGSTDLEARTVVDHFVAFAGVEERANVVAGADTVVRALSLLPVLALALAAGGPYSAGIQSLIDRGQALLDAPTQPTPGTPLV